VCLRHGTSSPCLDMRRSGFPHRGSVFCCPCQRISLPLLIFLPLLARGAGFVSLVSVSSTEVTCQNPFSSFRSTVGAPPDPPHRPFSWHRVPAPSFPFAVMCSGLRFKFFCSLASPRSLLAAAGGFASR
jgi:hypothetical protein